MRIGIVCYPTYGGSGVVATELGAALAKRGHQVHIISSSTPFRLATLELNDNIYFHEVSPVEYPVLTGSLSTLSLACKISQVANIEQLDLVHAHYAIPHAASAYMAREMLRGHRHLPFITTCHGTDITLVGQSPQLVCVVKFILKQSDAVTTVSDWLAVETRKNFEVCPPVDIRTIYNFIDAERFKPRPNPEFRARFARPDEKIVLHISNFRPVKRVLDVVRTFAKMADHVPAKLLMIGDGPDQTAAIEEAKRLGVMDRAWFLGKQNNIESYLGLANLFLFPSDHESFGLAALEAMSCEVPTIATRSGGLVEVISEGETGYLLEVGDVEGMAQKSVEILSDAVLAQKIGAAARQSVIERFQPGPIIEQYERLYEEVITQPNETPTPGSRPSPRDESATPDLEDPGKIAPDFLTA